MCKIKKGIENGVQVKQFTKSSFIPIGLTQKCYLSFRTTCSACMANKCQLKEHFNKNQDGVVIIGNGGGVKKRSKELFIRRLFELIDQIPMRLPEMNRWFQAIGELSQSGN